MLKQRVDGILKILEDINIEGLDYIAKPQKLSIEDKVWTNSNKGAFINKKIVRLCEENLKLYVNSNNNTYFFYGENRSSFKYIPQNNLKFMNEFKYKVSFDYMSKGDVDAKLYIIGYSDNVKVDEFIIEKNKKIAFNPKCRSYRVAIRVKGDGVFELKGITLNPIKEDVKYKIKKSQVKSEKRIIKNTKDINIASILDEFSYQNFSKECNVFNVTPTDYMEIISNNDIDFLFIESAWKGKNGSWDHKIAKYNNQDKSELYELIDYCKRLNIPTVFWNKEDPIHFEKFIDTAKLCDYVFTTDRNKVDDYKQEVGHNNVFSLPFAAQPKIHNPIKKYDKELGIVFAGSYYGNRHQDRKDDMHEILDICKPYNLAIYDRNYEITKNDKNNPFRYPDKYQENVKGSLKYTQIDRAYKGYEIMLNVNSVKQSPTMFSRRVFEGLSCGTPIISTYSKGIYEYFKDIVLIDENNKNLEKKLIDIIKDKRKRKEVSLVGIREVLSKHTYEDRLSYIMNKIGKPVDVKIPKVSIISTVNSEKEIEDIINLFNEIKYENKDLVILMTELFDGYIDCINKYNQGNIKCYIYEYIVNNYDVIGDLISGEYCSYINKSNLYGDNYILDLVLATKYANAEIIGKASYYTAKSKKNIEVLNVDEEYVYVDDIKSDRCIISTNKLSEYDIESAFAYLIGDKKIKDLFRQGISIFSIDNYNFIENGKKLKGITHVFK